MVELQPSKLARGSIPITRSTPRMARTAATTTDAKDDRTASDGESEIRADEPPATGDDRHVDQADDADGGDHEGAGGVGGATFMATTR